MAKKITRLVSETIERNIWREKLTVFDSMFVVLYPAQGKDSDFEEAFRNFGIPYQKAIRKGYLSVLTISQIRQFQKVNPPYLEFIDTMENMRHAE